MASRSSGPDEQILDPTKTPDSPRSFHLTARYDQAPFDWDSADLAELRSIASCSSSDVDNYLIEVLDPLNFRTIGSSPRLFSASNEKYLLPIDEEEFRRLDKQHILLRLGQPSILQSVLRSILADGENKTVLDVGCGSGQWAMELATQHAKVSVVAIDEAAQTRENVPSNVDFRRHNVNDGLAPFYGCYDVVHVRCIGAGITSYRDLLLEATQCVKPGGLAIFVEGDFDLLDEDQITILEPASDNNENGSWMQRWMQSVRRAQIRRCNLSGVDDSPETLDKGLWQFSEYHEPSCGTGSIFTPVSPWPVGDFNEEALHYKVTGVLMRQNLKMFIMATKQLLIEDGLTSQQIEDWAPKAIAELENDATYHAWFRWRIAWGRTKPLASNPTISANSTTQEHGQNQVRPNKVPRDMAAETELKDKVRHFQIPHCHVRNREQSLTYIAERTGDRFSTRGQF